METKVRLNEIFEDYRKNWHLLDDLFEKIPEEKLSWSISPDNRTLKQQLAHVVGVEKCYLEVIKKGAEGWKHCHMENERAKLSKKDLLTLFRKSNIELEKVISEMNGDEPIDWTEGNFLSLTEHLVDLNHHQIFHHGQLVVNVREFGAKYFPPSWSIYGY